MIFAIIIFDDITSTFVCSMKLTFVKMSLNHHSDNILRFLHQKEE